MSGELDLTLIRRQHALGYGQCHVDELIAEVERLRAQLLAGATPEGWQPIETAPKDGTEVLLLGRWFSQARIVNGLWNSGDAMHMPHWMGGIHQPTHWMPLPAPPAPASEGQ